jgi:large subunit ribosomal protein L10
LDRSEKRELVSRLNEAFSATAVVVVAHYAGLSVADMTALRGRARVSGASVKVAKNRLAKRALEGTGMAHLSAILEGPTLLAYSSDPVAAPKVLAEFAGANDKLVIMGGALGETRLDSVAVKALATLPSLDELRARLVGLISTPATRVAQVLNAPAAQLARVFAAYGKTDQAA